ncbi:MAG: hypothetical protein JWO69_311, partial [Thermoleophilia bacterium]|nr:hypothetical protein [Thermoleophilia bacterium]
DHSSNYAWFKGRDKEINDTMASMDLKARAKAWGALDRKLIEEDAVWAPLSHGVQRNLMGKRVGDYTFHPLYDFLFMKATVDGSGTNNKDTHEHEVGAKAADGDAAAEGGDA